MQLINTRKCKFSSPDFRKKSLYEKRIKTPFKNSKIESPSKFRLRRMNQNDNKGYSMKTIIRPLTNYSTTRPINLQKPQTTIKNGPTRRITYSISDNKAQCKLLIIHFEGLIGYLVNNGINHKERTLKMRPGMSVKQIMQLAFSH